MLSLFYQWILEILFCVQTNRKTYTLYLNIFNQKVNSLQTENWTKSWENDDDAAKTKNSITSFFHFPRKTILSYKCICFFLPCNSVLKLVLLRLLSKKLLFFSLSKFHFTETKCVAFNFKRSFKNNASGLFIPYHATLL